MTEISVKIDMDDLREIYWGEGYQRYFFGPTTKRQSLFLVIAGIIYPFFAWQTIRLEDDTLFVLGSAAMGFFIYGFLKVAQPVIKWKKSVTTFLANTGKIKTLKILYTDEYIIHKQDDTEIKMNWSTITRALITDRFISFEKSPDTFLVPKKSITEAEFQSLATILMEKVQHVERRNS